MQIGQLKEVLTLTDTQVAYWNMMENVTHNRNVEGETVRHNKKTEQQQDKNLLIASRNQKEIVRHNKAGEAIDKSRVRETVRHNKKSEKQTDVAQREITRHNKRTERQTDRSISESIRHNKRTESQTDRSLNISYMNAAENIRHNRKTESLTDYANKTNRRLANSNISVNSARKENIERNTMNSAQEQLRRNLINDNTIAVNEKTRPAQIAQQYTGIFGSLLSGASSLIRAIK